MSRMKNVMVAGMVMGTAALFACSGNWNVGRTDPKNTHDVDYRFNDEDARMASLVVTRECLSAPWIEKWQREHNGKNPIVVLGNVRNDTQDYQVNPKLFTEAIEREMINSGRIDLKSIKNAREELRDERLDTKFNDPATLKAVAKELNADFMMTGNVQQNLQRSNDGNKMVNYYAINMEITNVETAQIVWKATPTEIKKLVDK